MTRNLIELETLLLTREIALHLANDRLGTAMLHVWNWADDDARDYLAPFVDARDAAERMVGSVKELIGFLTPSSWQTNAR